MKKITTTDQLKLVFQTALQTNPDDWKRGPKTRNEKGEWVRDFENTKTGDTLKVTETGDGQFNIKGKDMEMNVSLPVQFRKAAAPAVDTWALNAPVIETDPAMNAAADRAIAIVMGDERRKDREVPKDVLDSAGRALANRYGFAIIQEEGDDGFTVGITPLQFFREEGRIKDQSDPIDDLLPKIGEVQPSIWQIYDDSIKTPVEAAKLLQSLGFQWSRDMQNDNDKKTGKELESFIQAVEDVSPAKPAEDMVMDIVMKGKRDVPYQLMNRVDDKKLAAKFTFTVVEDEDRGGILAIVTPKGLDDEFSKKSIQVMEHIFPKAEYIDDSVYGLWKLPRMNTLAKLGEKLEAAGFEWEASNKQETLSAKAPAAGKAKPKKYNP